MNAAFTRPAGEDALVQVLSALDKRVEGREILIDDAIQQRVEQDARAPLRLLLVALPAPFRLIQRGNRIVVDGQQIVFADEDAQFLRLDTPIVVDERAASRRGAPIRRAIVLRERVEDEEEEAVVLLDLGALMSSQGVFHRQWVEV